MERNAMDRLEKRSALRGVRAESPPAPSPPTQQSVGFPCPRCGLQTRVSATQDFARTLGYRRRKRRCDACGCAFATKEELESGNAATERMISPQWQQKP